MPALESPIAGGCLIGPEALMAAHLIFVRTPLTPNFLGFICTVMQR